MTRRISPAIPYAFVLFFITILNEYSVIDKLDSCY
jgi:hypothetical protein